MSLAPGSTATIPFSIEKTNLPYLQGFRMGGTGLEPVQCPHELGHFWVFVPVSAAATMSVF